jgi:hypothetical protein
MRTSRFAIAMALAGVVTAWGCAPPKPAATPANVAPTPAAAPASPAASGGGAPGAVPQTEKEEAPKAKRKSRGLPGQDDQFEGGGGLGVEKKE